MSTSEVSLNLPRVRERRLDVRVLLAFAAIYLLWGATFLAIRIAVLQIPPFFTAGLRFFSAGALLYAFMRLSGQPSPSAAQWRSIAVTALCMFVATYGALFWAEQYVPSGVTSVIEATLPITTIAFEVFIFRQQPFRWRMLAAVLLGFCGVAWLLLKNGQQPLAVLPCLVILAGGAAWSLGAVLTRSMPRPESLPLAAGAQMMLGGAVLLALSQATGELQPFPHICARRTGAVVSNRRRFAARLHGVCLATGAHAGDPRRESRLCESPGRCRLGVLCRRGGAYDANDHGVRCGDRERLPDSQRPVRP